MRFTLQTDYALRVLMYLGLTGDDLATIAEIAERYGISDNHLMKVVSQLGRRGYITTIRGRQGGLRLARAPEEIGIGEVVRAFEGELQIVECFNPETNTCPISGLCGLAGMIDEALSAFLDVLDRKTLADVLHRSSGIQQVLGFEGGQR